MTSLAPIAPDHVATEPTTVFLKEKKMSLSGDSATVKDKDGNDVFKIDAKLMTMSQTRYFKDVATGKVLGQLRRKKTPSMHTYIYIGPSAAEEKKVQLKSKSSFNPTNSNAEIILDNKVIGDISGDWKGKSYTITIEGNVVAKINRKSTFQSAGAFFCDADSYCIDIETGMDKLFATMIAIGLDEMFHDDN